MRCEEAKRRKDEAITKSKAKQQQARGAQPPLTKSSGQASGGDKRPRHGDDHSRVPKNLNQVQMTLSMRKALHRHQPRPKDH